MIKNQYSLLTEESEENIPEKFHTNEHGKLEDNQSGNGNHSINNQSGNEQYLIPKTVATATCVTLNTKLENEKKVNDGMWVQSCTGTITTAIAMGDLLLKNLPQEARRANKIDVTLPLLSVGKVCDSDCTAVFRKGDILIANDNDINIKLLSNPLVTGSRDKAGL